MTILTPLRSISTSDLHVHLGTKTFSQEASTLGSVFRNGPYRIYDDACDEGLALFNPYTGRMIWFALTESDIDHEGDVRAWVFIPIPEAVRKNPKLKGWSLVVYND